MSTGNDWWVKGEGKKRREMPFLGLTNMRIDIHTFFFCFLEKKIYTLSSFDTKK